MLSALFFFLKHYQKFTRGWEEGGFVSAGSILLKNNLKTSLNLSCWLWGRLVLFFSTSFRFIGDSQTTGLLLSKIAFCIVSFVLSKPVDGNAHNSYFHFPSFFCNISKPSSKFTWKLAGKHGDWHDLFCWHVRLFGKVAYLHIHLESCLGRLQTKSHIFYLF